MTPEEHLLAAADDMAQHGHYKQSYFKPDEDRATAPACALGSIARTANLPSAVTAEVTPAAHRLAAHIRDRFPHLNDKSDYYTITTFNDDDTTTAEDMILAFKGAAHD